MKKYINNVLSNVVKQIRYRVFNRISSMCLKMFLIARETPYKTAKMRAVRHWELVLIQGFKWDID